MILNGKVVIVSVVCIILGIALSWLLFGGANLYNHGNGIESAYEQSERIGEYQQSVDESLERIRDGLDNGINSVIGIEERNSKIEESVDRATSNNKRSTELIGEGAKRIEESKSILERVRERKSED